MNCEFVVVNFASVRTAPRTAIKAAAIKRIEEAAEKHHRPRIIAEVRWQTICRVTFGGLCL